MPIFQLNDEILAAAGTRWDDWQPLRDGWFNSPRFNEFRFRAIEVLEAEYGKASLIYLKDPRLCRLLPLWQYALEEMGYRVVCVHTHRHPADVATSLKERKNIKVEPSLGMLSWLRHTLDAEFASRRLPRVFTSYASVLHDWQDFADRAETAFNFTWPVMGHTAQERVAQLIDPNLRNHKSSISSYLRDPLAPETIRSTLQILENWVQEGENSDDFPKLDGLRNDFDRLAPLLYAPTSALRLAIRDNEALIGHKATAEARQVENEALTKELSDAQGQHAQLSSQQEKLRAELDQSRADAKAAKAQVETAEAEIVALTKKLAQAEGERAQLSSQQETLRAELDRGRADAEAAAAQAETAEAEIVALTQKLAEAEGQCAQLSSQQEQLRAELDQSRADAEAAKSQAETDKAEIATLTKRLAEADGNVSKLLDEITTGTDRLIDRDKKISRLQRESDLNRRELSKRDGDAEMLSGKLAEVEGQRAQLSSQQEQLRAKLDSLQIEHANAIESVHNLYKTSTSWKVSAPIRFIRSRLWKR
ncbi:MAG: hypothetical protein V2I43_19450 [Parvularcula sp.]|nr:hypothetical protein [Parvularcula sp.]